MHYLELPAPPPLDQIVRCFWFLRSDEVSGVPQPVVADGRLEIVLHAAEPFSRIINGRGYAQGDALLAGQLTTPLHLLQRGPADVVGIRFRTAAANAVLRHAIAELTDEVAPLGLIDPALRNSLLLALRGSTDPLPRRDALAKVLLRHVRQAPDRLTMTAVHALDVSSSRTLATIARRLGTSTRTLERRVALATGLTPRSLRQTLRFRRVFGALQGAKPGTMTAVALEAGYFDQAHCIREFRRFTGQAPSDFFAGDPALASALVASVQSPAGETSHL